MTFSSRNLCNLIIPSEITAIVILSYCLYQAIVVKMSVPQGAFAARKVRENEEKLKTFGCDLTPTKYSSKYMNSVWGMYNRYSVHNFKKNMDAGMFAFTAQQQKSAGPKQSVERTSTDLRSLSPQCNILASAEFL